MITIDALCRATQEQAHRPWSAAAAPGSLIAAALRPLGLHVSDDPHLIWRRALVCKGKISSLSHLTRGMLVFRLECNPWNEERFTHVGLVTGTAPLRILHLCPDGSTAADLSGDAWTHWGTLRGVCSGEQHAVTGPTLRLCSRGSEVVQLQKMLRELDFALWPDGIFGPMTREAVKTFQAVHHLPATGCVGPADWHALEACCRGVSPNKKSGGDHAA